jgi:hypothetical protein
MKSLFDAEQETKCLMNPTREQFEVALAQGWQPLCVVLIKNGGEEEVMGMKPVQGITTVRYGVGPA